MGLQRLHLCALEDRQRIPGRHRLQRLFSTFPGGWPGIGLLLLRAAAGVTLLVQGISYLADWNDPGFGTLAVGLLAVASGASLLIGFLTQIAAVLGCASIALSWFPSPAPDLSDTGLSIVFVVIIAVAVALTGPGAFSLDARLFGRREIIIPHASRSPKT